MSIRQTGQPKAEFSYLHFHLSHFPFPYYHASHFRRLTAVSQR